MSFSGSPPENPRLQTGAATYYRCAAECTLVHRSRPALLLCLCSSSFSLCFYWGTNWLQQQLQMLVGRNGENKTNLIANKLHGEFSWLCLLQGLWGWRGGEEAPAEIHPEQSVSHLWCNWISDPSAAGRPQRDCHNHSSSLRSAQGQADKEDIYN